MAATKRPLFDPLIVRRAIKDSFVKLAAATWSGTRSCSWSWSAPCSLPSCWSATCCRGTRNRVHAPVHTVAVVHRPLREFRRGDGRRPGQGPGRALRKTPPRDPGEEAEEPRRTLSMPDRAVQRAQGRRPGALHPRDLIPATAKSLKAWPRWTSRRSPANRRRSSASPAATGRPSPGARRCFPISSSCGSRPTRVRPSSTA